MMSSQVHRAVAAVAVCGALLLGGAAAPAVATSSGQAAALAQMKKDWAKKSNQVRKGTCATYNKYPESTIATETNKLWSDKKNHKSMTAAEWLKVVRKFYKWAC